MNERICRQCGVHIPEDYHKSRRYCGEKCESEARRIRSGNRYKKMRALYEALKTNDQLLSQYYPIQGTFIITYLFLQELGFDFGCSLRRFLSGNGRIFLVTGRYAYTIIDGGIIIKKEHKDF